MGRGHTCGAMALSGIGEVNKLTQVEAQRFIASSQTLSDLVDRVRQATHIEDAHRLDFSNLPTFGGERPRDTRRIWSWDERFLLVGDGGPHEWRIVPRDEPDDLRI